MEDDNVTGTSESKEILPESIEQAELNEPQNRVNNTGEEISWTGHRSQKEKYLKAVARLAQYELSAGKKGVIRTENVWDMSTNSYVDRDVVGYIIEPLPLWVDGVGRNPEVVQDEAQREAAQIVISKTPQAVIDSINT